MQRHVEALAGDWLRGLRRRMNLTQVELAEKLGVHPITIARWEGTHRIGAKNRALLNNIARLHNYPPLAPARRKRKGARQELVLHLPPGWQEREDDHD